MKFAEKDLVSLVRDPTSVGVVLSVTPCYTPGVVSGNHYQIYWSTGTNHEVEVEECWHTEEELTQARK